MIEENVQTKNRDSCNQGHSPDSGRQAPGMGAPGGHRICNIHWLGGPDSPTPKFWGKIACTKLNEFIVE